MVRDISLNEDDTIVSMLIRSVEVFSQRPALRIKDNDTFRTITYGQLFGLIEEFACGLIHLGFQRGDHIGLISDNRMEWLISDLAILGIGCVDVPRGSSSLEGEILSILSHSDAKAVLVENREQFLKLGEIQKRIPQIEAIVVLEEGFKGDRDNNIFSFDDVVEMGRGLLKKDERLFMKRIKQVKSDDLATIIYTSGTTGEPKGVMLTHGNIMHNVRVAPPQFDISERDRFLSLLPTWHIFERTLEYMTLSCGASIAYSKPVRQVFMEDIKLVKPTYMVCVPRIWEGIYKGILAGVKKRGMVKRCLFGFFFHVGEIYVRALRMLNATYPCYKKEGHFILKSKRFIARLVKAFLHGLYKIGDNLIFRRIRDKILGKDLVNLISGGAALPRIVDEFFETIGVTIMEGYGLTETSPVVCTRRHHHRVMYTVGPPLPEVEVKIVDKENRPLPPGNTGLIKIRGPLVMKGYYKRRDLTAKVIDKDGWLDSGDLGRMTINGEIKIMGREKDTIVLLGGENIEPVPIENRLKESPFIAQAVVVGQDKKYLGALLIPDFEALRAHKGLQLNSHSNIDIVRDKGVLDLVKGEMKRLINPKDGFHSFERVYHFSLLSSDFKIGRELTHTMKLKRDVIHRLYMKETNKIFGE